MKFKRFMYSLKHIISLQYILLEKKSGTKIFRLKCIILTPYFVQLRTVRENDSNWFCFMQTLWLSAKVKITNNGIKWQISSVLIIIVDIIKCDKKPCKYWPTLPFLPHKTACWLDEDALWYSWTRCSYSYDKKKVLYTLHCELLLKRWILYVCTCMRVHLCVCVSVYVSVCVCVCVCVCSLIIKRLGKWQEWTGVLKIILHHKDAHIPTHVHTSIHTRTFVHTHTHCSKILQSSGKQQSEDPCSFCLPPPPPTPQPAPSRSHGPESAQTPPACKNYCHQHYLKVWKLSSITTNFAMLCVRVLGGGGHTCVHAHAREIDFTCVCM